MCFVKFRWRYLFVGFAIDCSCVFRGGLQFLWLPLRTSDVERFTASVAASRSSALPGGCVVWRVVGIDLA